MSEVGVFYPEDFGAKGDGKNDDAEAIQKAIDAAKHVFGTVRLLPRSYLIKSPLNTRLGRFTIRGSGWWQNLQSGYEDSGEAALWNNYRSDPYEAAIVNGKPSNVGVAGTVLYCQDCGAFVRDNEPADGPCKGNQHGDLTIEDLAIVGRPALRSDVDGSIDPFPKHELVGPNPVMDHLKGTAAVGEPRYIEDLYYMPSRYRCHTAVDFGSTHAAASNRNTYRNVLFARWAIGVDLSFHYYGYFQGCWFITCKEAVRNGRPLSYPSGENDLGQGGNVNLFLGCCWESCDRAFALYEAARLDVIGSLIQNHLHALYLRPRGNGTVAFVTLRGIHVESQREGNRLLVLDPSGVPASPEPGDIRAATKIVLQDINVNGCWPSLCDESTKTTGKCVNCAPFPLFDFGNRTDGKAEIRDLVLANISAPGCRAVIPKHVRPVHVRGGTFFPLIVESDLAEVVLAQSVADPLSPYLNLSTLPASQASRLPESNWIGGRRLTGTVTISGSNRSATVPPQSPDFNTGYSMLVTVESSSGNPAHGALMVTQIEKNTSTGTFTIHVRDAPGSGATVTYRWALVT